MKDIRFAFGKNWRRFLSDIDQERITGAEQSLTELLGRDSLDGLTFLDVGSGSGLFSLAARNLGAVVRSIDYDKESVACAQALRERFRNDDTQWSIEEGSVLSQEFAADKRQYDVTYSWGVLHHTGDMWRAIDNTLGKVRPGGCMVISIYNDQGWLSTYWKAVKLLYNKHLVFRLLMILLHAPYLLGARYIVRMLTGRGRLERGMSYWHDMIDWLGGLPFEVARPEEVIMYVQSCNYRLSYLKTCGGRSGCNEFVFENTD